MDAQHTPAPVKQVVELTRLSTALFSVLALLVAFGAVIVASNKSDGGGKTAQAGSVKTAAVLDAAAIPATATAPIVAKQGDYLLVHYLNEGVMAHPMHLHGLTKRVIAKDGISLQFPYEADTINVAPGERYTVLVRASEPGVWAWHCHILPHAEGEDGMFGMVTAMIVE